MKTKQTKLTKGFTLLELLIVIAILAILMSIVVVTLNPAELLKKSRDTKRISDLGSLKTALNLYVTDVASPDLDLTGTCGTNIWVSLAGTAGERTDGDGKTMTYVASATARDVDGTGWLPVNLGSISSGSPLSSMPVDPTNATSTTAANNLYYAYQCDATASTFELNAQMESAYFVNGGSGDVESKDGGDAADLYEVGSDPGLDLATNTPTSYFYQWP